MPDQEHARLTVSCSQSEEIISPPFLWQPLDRETKLMKALLKPSLDGIDARFIVCSRIDPGQVPKIREVVIEVILKIGNDWI
jgi:hypothetical protein